MFQGYVGVPLNSTSISPESAAYRIPTASSPSKLTRTVSSASCTRRLRLPHIGCKWPVRNQWKSFVYCTVQGTSKYHHPGVKRIIGSMWYNFQSLGPSIPYGIYSTMFTNLASKAFIIALHIIWWIPTRCKNLRKSRRKAEFKEEDDNKVGLLYCTSSPKSNLQKGMFHLWVSGSFVTNLLWDFSSQMYLPNASMLVSQNVRHLGSWGCRQSDPLSLANTKSVIHKWPIWDGCVQTAHGACYISPMHISNRLQKKWLSASSWTSPEFSAVTFGMAPALESRPDCEMNYSDVDECPSSEHVRAGSHVAAWILELLLSRRSPRLA